MMPTLVPRAAAPGSKEVRASAFLAAVWVPSAIDENPTWKLTDNSSSWAWA